jgi:hypothetical protein
MRCALEDVLGTTDERGWRRVRCRRSGCQWNAQPLDHTPHDCSTIQVQCTGWPLLSERELWLEGFARAVGVTQAAAAFQRWIDGGSKLEDLPPEIPRPVLPALNAGLTDAEVKELFPDETDPTLIGNRIKALTEALGIPHCGGCDARRKWLNAAHEKLREWMGRA